MASPPSGWSAKLDVDHPLVGRIWDARSRGFLPLESLFERGTRAKFVLLGEKHDASDHHVLQAEFLRRIVALGRRPAVAFEMLEAKDQSVIDRFLASGEREVAPLGAQLDWERSGWPSFPLYAPVFQAAVDAKLPIVAANLPLATVRAIVHQRELDAEELHALGLDVPFAPELERDLERELRSSHCGHLPEAMLGPMALAQRARDGSMARALVAADRANGGRGAVLIAGAGHTRTDRGVPMVLSRLAPSASVLAIAFREVASDQTDPSSYASDADVVWFTPRVDDEDPCARFSKPSSR